MGEAVRVGSEAPDFTLPADDGSEFRLHGLRGSIVVLYFYPRAFTPGCTREALGFNERLREFEELGGVVVGVSTDPVGRLARFKEKLGLQFTLLSDAEGRVASLYGVLRRGGKRPGAERATFILDSDMIVKAVIRGVRLAEKHVELASVHVASLRRERRDPY